MWPFLKGGLGCPYVFHVKHVYIPRMLPYPRPTPPPRSATGALSTLLPAPLTPGTTVLTAAGPPILHAQQTSARSPSPAAAAIRYAAAEQPLPPSRSLSPTWRANAPAQELYVVNFNRLLLMGDFDGAAALLARAPGLVNAAKDGQPPLHAAVRAKSLPLVQLLAHRGADLRAVDASGRTAVEAATAAGAVGIAAWLDRASRL